VWEYLPRGNTLDAEAFHRRHSLLTWVLALHVPALFAFGVWQGFGVRHSALEVAVPTACVVLARVARNRRAADIFFIGFQERLNKDFEAVKALLGLPADMKLPADDVQAHRNPAHLDRKLAVALR